ncbi:MAG TPA: amidase [Roseiarcus sp.]|nr:amidase [Roseiarcus sp.]
MGIFAEYGDYDGLGLAELVRKGSVHPRELVEAAIARIEAANPKLNAVVTKLYEMARLQADAPVSGPFAGVPFLLKDLGASLASAPTSQGTRGLKAIPRTYDDELVKRYRNAGLIVVGKTNTPEFGLAPVTEPEAFGPTHNPYDLERTPGGSSGGSGAAVAARLTPMAHASDGGGSIRIPASYCALVGLKPTRGRTPTGPVAGEPWRGFSIAHAVTRSVRDSAALLDATQGSDIGAPYAIAPPARPYLTEVSTPPGRLRIAATTKPFLARSVDPECVKGVESTVSLLRELGHEVEEAGPPIDPEPWRMAFLTIVAGETAAELEETARLMGSKAGPPEFERLTAVIGLLGRSFSARDYVAAARYLHTWARSVGAFFERYDVLLTPTLASPPVRIGALRPTAAERVALSAISGLGAGWLMRASGLVQTLAGKSFELMPYTPLFNVTGQPAVSLPLYWSEAGLPIGMHFASRWGDEATLFRLGAQLEKARPWIARAPKGF